MAPPPPSAAVSEVQVESVKFPPSVKPPGSAKTHFLGGAGVRGLEIQGKFIKFTAIGVYLEDAALPSLAAKWSGKSAEELADCVEFFRDIVTGPFEKFSRVTMILPLTGAQYAEKVTENCVKYWQSVGTYTDAEAAAVEKFCKAFKDKTFPPGSSILFTQSPNGSLTIAFSEDGSVPEALNTVIENRQLTEAVLESMIGKHGVSPQAKTSLASRIRELLKGCEKKADEVDKNVAAKVDIVSVA
ncbi:chalcone--flavanone isomerase-like [Syzygium oleosum]|uniref:chalcone--flavanone isomerase-like n=1 Tax=Syzygium oleosum TaxID=219896 RepID=UPI0011D29D31|nr:chalcone--flavanone isomerase-like [Syzygium oleosum]